MIAAAGTGERLGAGGPKAFVELAGRPMLEWSLDAFRGASSIDEIVIAAGSRYSNRDAERLAARAMKRFSLPTSHIAEPLPHAA